MSDHDEKLILEAEVVRLRGEVVRLRGELNQERISREIERGHTEHCAKRQVHGDGECECSHAPTTITEWATVIHQYAKDKGWWDEERNIGDLFMLFTCEVSEAYEEYRNGHEVTEVYYKDEHGETYPARENGLAPPGMKPEGVPVELADVVIRILDFCEFAGIDLQAIMAEKHAYNLTRAYRHGGKRT